MDKPALHFRSAKFLIDPTEDEETNPFCYGRSLAQWLRGKLTSLGYSPEEVIPEDFGWVVVLSRGAGMLWVGCVNDHHHLYAQVSPEAKSSYVPDAEPVLDHLGQRRQSDVVAQLPETEGQNFRASSVGCGSRASAVPDSSVRTWHRGAGGECGLTCQSTRTHNSRRRLRRLCWWSGHLYVRP